MADRPYRGPIDYEKLGHYLRALSVPTRILLLEKLQHPRTPSEIELPPFRRDADLRPDRVLSRQTVEQHLDVLEEAGLVRSRPAKRGGQSVTEFLVNQERLFTLVDEVRRLSLMRVATGAGAGATGPATFRLRPRETSGSRVLQDALPATVRADVDADPVLLPEGPSLVLVSGPLEGKAFPLAGAGSWRIGRAAEAEVSLAYDPFVSALNSEVVRDGDAFRLVALAGSKNGTTLNWRMLEPGKPVPLASGDAIGLGRSLVVARGL